ncbi:hypothetical protein SAMN05660745_01824 [Corynebacterium glucuronolyticum]|nr:hypothetical protein SAMN05660745_01824 [Corynebacterium glucuronolyticum]
MQLARGVYVVQGEYQKLSREDKYLLRCAALGIEGRPLIGASAAALWGMPVIVHKREQVHIIGTGRPRAGVCQTRLTRGDLRTTTVCGFEISLTSPALTVIDIARWHGLAEAVRCGDFALATNLTTEDELLYAIHHRAKTNGIKTARTAVRLINNLSESPRESDVKVALFEAGFPAPFQQASIYNTDGAFIGRVDFFYPDRSIALEYDGFGKTHGEFDEPTVLSVNRELTRHRRLESEALTLIRIDNESWKTKLFLRQLDRLWPLRGRFPSDQWFAPGLAWDSE